MKDREKCLTTQRRRIPSLSFLQSLFHSIIMVLEGDSFFGSAMRSILLAEQPNALFEQTHATRTLLLCSASILSTLSFPPPQGVVPREQLSAQCVDVVQVHLLRLLPRQDSGVRRDVYNHTPLQLPPSNKSPNNRRPTTSFSKKSTLELCSWYTSTHGRRFCIDFSSSHIAVSASSNS